MHSISPIMTHSVVWPELARCGYSTSPSRLSLWLPVFIYQLLKMPTDWLKGKSSKIKPKIPNKVAEQFNHSDGSWRQKESSLQNKTENTNNE